MNLQKKLAHLKKENALTTEELSRLSGVPRGTLNKLLCGATRNPTAQTLQRLAQALNCPLDALSDAPETIPSADKPSPNHPSSASHETPSIPADLPPLFLASALSAPADSLAYDFIFPASDDSMIGARIRRGDLVFIRRQNDVDDGRIAAVAINGTLSLKRVYHIPNGLQLLSDNPLYPPILYTSADPVILGLAVGFQSKL